MDPRGAFEADDWGLSPAVNEAILELAARGLLGAVSLFANLPYLEHGLDRLLRCRLELHAHLNFSLGRPLSAGRGLCDAKGVFFPFRNFLLRGALGRIPSSALVEEAEAQLGRLEALVPLQGVNGHEHALLLPWVARALGPLLRRRGYSTMRGFRDLSHPGSWLSTRWSRGAWSGFEREQLLYQWPTGRADPKRIRAKLARLRPGERILVHPASHDDFGGLEFRDGLRGARVRELQALRGLLE